MHSRVNTKSRPETARDSEDELQLLSDFKRSAIRYDWIKTEENKKALLSKIDEVAGRDFTSDLGQDIVGKVKEAISLSNGQGEEALLKKIPEVFPAPGCKEI